MLTIGFARRVPTYKRLTLMLRDPDRLEQLLLNEDKPIQLIVAGKSHPADDGGKALIQQVVQFADRPEVRHRIAFLPDYDMSMARLLYWGCDVWLNNPLRPLEACGTSGMKSALNGGLNLSILTGGGTSGTTARTVGRYRRPPGSPTRTVVTTWRRPRSTTCCRSRWRRSSTSATSTELRAGGSRWCATRCRRSARKCWPRRMVRDYTEGYYLPAAESLRRTVSVDGDGQSAFDPARELAGYRRRAFEEWPHIQITDVDSTGLPDTPVLGSKLTLTATVQLAGLRPDEVTVQAVVGRVDTGDALVDPITVDMPYTGTAAGGDHIFSTTTPLPVAGSVGYTVRVLPNNPMLASAAELGLVTLA